MYPCTSRIYMSEKFYIKREGDIPFSPCARLLLGVDLFLTEYVI